MSPIALTTAAGSPPVAAALSAAVGVAEPERAADDQAEREQPEEEPVGDAAGEDARRDAPVPLGGAEGDSDRDVVLALRAWPSLRRLRSARGRGRRCRPAFRRLGGSAEAGSGSTRDGPIVSSEGILRAYDALDGRLAGGLPFTRVITKDGGFGRACCKMWIHDA